MADSESSPSKGQHRTSLPSLDWTRGESGQFAAFPLGEGNHDPVVVIVEYAPGVEIEPHHHKSDYFSMVLQGDIEITRRREEVGSIRHVRATTTYGPLRVGPEGCTVLEVFADRTTFVEPQFARRAAGNPTAAINPMPALFAEAIEKANGYRR